MKRKDALNLIKVEYAKHGEATAIAMRTYAEARKAGLEIFDGQVSQ